MTGEEYVALSRHIRIRKLAVQKGEIDLRIVLADKDRIEAGLATDRAFIAQGQARLDAHWQEWNSTTGVTA